MDDPKKVHENLKQLLTELQKVKDLNNLANEYKEVAANLTLSLQQYLKDSQTFSNAFNDYLIQTNKSVEDTKTAVDNAIEVIKDSMTKFNVADEKIGSQINAFSVNMRQLEQQGLRLEELYNSCITQGQQLRNETEVIFSKATSEISTYHADITDKMDSLQSFLSTEISQSIQTISVALYKTEEQISNVNLYLKQMSSVFHQDIIQTDIKIDNASNLLSLLKKENLISSKSLQRDLEQSTNRLSSRIGKLQIIEWLSVVAIVVVIVLLIINN